jgi:hypothetical protein
MRPVSDMFLRTVRGSHVALSRARVCAPGQTGTDPDGTEVTVLGGDVILDGTAAIRGTLDMLIDGTGLWPRNASDPITPYGNEVFVERGIVYGNGVTEYVSQGYYRIYTQEQQSAPDGGIRIDGRDRMSGIVDARLLAPIQYTVSNTYGGILASLVTDVYPDATIEWDDATSSESLGRQLVAEEDRFAFLDDLVRSVGKIWYWDHRGVLVITTAPDPDVPVFDVNQGRDGVLVEMSRDLSREGVYNAVVAYGEAGDTQTPARAVAVDNSPVSPTYFYGDFGKVPRYYSSPFITTNAQALSAATAILRQALGLPYNVDFKMVPNVALEPHDPVSIVYPLRARALSSRTETHILERIQIPLDVTDPMAATTREQTLVTIGEA